MNALAIQSEASYGSYLDAIKDIFHQSSADIAVHPQIMLEIIAYQAHGLSLQPHTLTNAEKWLYFQDIEGVEKLIGFGLESILPELINKAVNAGELDKNCDQDLLFLTLSSLFFGTALFLLKNRPEDFSALLLTQINSWSPCW